MQIITTAEKKRSSTFVEDHRWLVPFLASKTPLHALSFTFPLWGIFLYFGMRGGFQLTHIVQFLSGVFYWSFFEYAMHRFIYHYRPDSAKLRYIAEGFHVYHHRNLGDFSVLTAGPFLAIPLTFFLGLPVYYCTGEDIASSARILFGTSVAYYIYEWFHYAIHKFEFNGGLLGYMQKYHFYHHEKNWNRCFSVTNPFWDIVFQTHVKMKETGK